MVLNKQKGDMYNFVNFTWNPIKGKCSHDCSYCFMKRFPQKPIRLVEKELKDDLGEGNFIFVGSSTDMFAEDVPSWWIGEILAKCLKHKNKYLFQTKNPERFAEFMGALSFLNCILGVTIETDSDKNANDISNAPLICDRVRAMEHFKDFDKMATIEPILDFNLEGMVEIIKMIKPEFVNIGADSMGHNLQEPSSEKIEQLIKELKKFTKVNLKDNLKRLLK